MTHFEITLLEELLKANAQVSIMRRYTYQLPSTEQKRLEKELNDRGLALADNSRSEALRVARLARNSGLAA